MFSVTGQFEITNISEIRTKISEITDKISRRKRVIVTKNNEPSMIIMNFDEYQELIALLEDYEDTHFGQIAEERLETFDRKTSYSLEEVEKIVDLS